MGRVFQSIGLALVIGLSSISAQASQEAGALSVDKEAQACQLAKQFLREGDLIFLNIDNLIYRKVVAEITSSWASHVGIAFKNEKDQWIVAESTFPWAKDTELCKYLQKTKGTLFQIRRVKSLSPDEVARLREQTKMRLDQFYDTGFDYHESGTSFCSKFVYDSYLQGLGIEVGQLETFAQLREQKLKEDPNYDYSFIYLWFVRMEIPWDRVTVTPASQLRDPRLTTILHNEAGL